MVSKEVRIIKQKWLDLNWPRRIMIFIQAFLVLLFLVLHLTVGRQQIITYHNETLCRHIKGEVITYSGTINGEKAVFTVTGTTVEYRLGSTEYGPYTITSAPDAVPDEDALPSYTPFTDRLNGVEIRKGDELLFRGAYQSSDSLFYVVDSQGNVSYGDAQSFGLIDSGYSGDVYGYTHEAEPGAYSILKIAAASGVVQRSSLGMFLLGALLCIVNAVGILYVDELFRWNLRFSIRNAENAEPSEWELFSRWIGWIVITIAALVIFIKGLNWY